MRTINTDFKPINDITTPLKGTPTYTNSGIIKTVMKSGEKISIAQIDYQEFDEENYQYIISPYWDIVDGLPTSVFQGIPGIDMGLRLKSYYRVNYVPVFITERTPSKNREDLWELLEEVGLDYYDRFEWLLRTDMRAGNDRLIVERRRNEKCVVKYGVENIQDLQYGDKVIVDSMETIANTSLGLADTMFSIVARGVDMATQDGKMLVDVSTRTTMISYMVAQRIMAYKERLQKRREGIDNAKNAGKYTGRKPIEVDLNILIEVSKELDSGVITIEEAMRRTKINSRSTFYRKLRLLKEK